MKCYFLIFTSLFLANCSTPTDDSGTGDPDPPVTHSRPNILLVIADDMGKDATPNFTEGSVKPNMPVLESLMQTGVTFNNAWSYSVCTPTRGSILTGKHGIHTGLLAVGDEISTSETSLQKYIDNNTNNAYAHAVIGKWHVSASPSSPTDMGVGYYAGLLTGGVQSYTNWNFTENGSTSNSTEYTTTKFTDLAIDWVDAQTKPWFLWLAFNAPHTPFHLAPTNLHSQGDLPTDAASISANKLPYFMSAIEAMDSELGRFLATLSSEERANTLIIFIGDNGTPHAVAQAPYVSNRVKGTIYQGGVNMPFVAAGKGVDRIGQTEDALVHTVDLFTTIANAAGIASTAVHNSASFYALLSDVNAPKRDFVYTELGGDDAGYTIRNETYKLLVYDSGVLEFYNLATDAYENTNLIGTSLSTEASAAKAALEAEAENIRM